MILIFASISTFTAWLTFKCINHTQMTPTRVSSGITLISLLIIHFFKITFSIHPIGLVPLIFGATFVGMASRKIFSERDIITAALIYTLIIKIHAPGQYGVGGALGFSAFCSIVIVWAISKVLIRIQKLR